MILLLLALPAQAEIPLSSLRPQPRPQIEPPPLVVLPPVSFAVAAPALRPRPRPADLAPVAAAPQPTATPTATAFPLATAQPDASIRRMSSVRPLSRPADLADKTVAQPEPVVQAAIAPEPKPKRETRAEKRQREQRKGSVCGVPAIKGEDIARITSTVTGCGIAEPVRVTSVSGVRLSQPATLDCATAQALNRWVETGLQPAYGRTQVVELRVAAHYICRSRNNVRGARISEHGRGKAIDISAITLDSGKTVAVLGGFGKDLRRAHKAACGIFGTTLGPGSDGYHEDNLHYDTASYRSGPYCR